MSISKRLMAVSLLVVGLSLVNSSIQAMQVQDPIIQNEELLHFQELVEKGQETEPALEVAERLIESTYKHVESANIEQFVALAKQYHDFELQTQTADSQKLMNRLVLQLMHMCVEREMANDFDDRTAEAIRRRTMLFYRNAAALAAESLNQNIQADGLDLFTKLFTKLVKEEEKWASVLAAEAAQKSSQSADSEIQRHALVLFNILVRKGQAFDPAAQEAERLSKSPYEDVRLEALMVFECLIEQGQAFALAAQAAQRLSESQNLKVRETATRLLKKLNDLKPKQGACFCCMAIDPE